MKLTLPRDLRSTAQPTAHCEDTLLQDSAGILRPVNVAQSARKLPAHRWLRAVIRALALVMALTSAARVTFAQVSMPTISPGTTTISGSTQVYLEDTTPGTTIIYTLDNTRPSLTNGSTCAPSSVVPCFTLLGGTTVKALAEDSSGNLSAVFAHTYTAPASSNACTGWNSQSVYAASDFEAHQADISSKGASLGVDCNGGGYVSYLNTGYGSFGNLIAFPYGRGFQPSIRDNLHSGFYNPTQAGITDGDGTPITLSLTDSPDGSGGRINVISHRMGLYLNAGFCFFPLSYYSPNDPNVQPYCDNSIVTDGIWDQEKSAGLTAAQQINSEFALKGFYQDASNLGNNSASIFEYNFSMTYLGNPGAPGNPGATTWLTPQTSSNYSPIYKFGPLATYSKNGVETPVLDTAYEGPSYEIPAYTNVSDPGSLTSVTPQDTDLVTAQVATGMRLQLTGGYTSYLILNATCTGWNAPQSLNLSKSATSYQANIFPAGSWPCGSVIAFEDPNAPSAPMIAMYYPQTDPVNKDQVTETNVSNGESISLDGRVQAFMIASTWIQPTVPTRSVNGIEFDNQFTEILPLLRVKGLLAPNHAGANIDESVNTDIYVLVGSPAQVLAALQNMNANQGWSW